MKDVARILRAATNPCFDLDDLLFTVEVDPGAALDALLSLLSEEETEIEVPARFTLALPAQGSWEHTSWKGTLVLSHTGYRIQFEGCQPLRVSRVRELEGGWYHLLLQVEPEGTKADLLVTVVQTGVQEWGLRVSLRYPEVVQLIQELERSTSVTEAVEKLESIGERGEYGGDGEGV